LTEISVTLAAAYQREIFEKKEKFVDDDITQVKSIMDDSSNPRNTQKLWLTGEADEK
jgi:hypothetical protein